MSLTKRHTSLLLHCLQGEAAGSAAHLVALQREAIGEHSVSDAWQLPDLVKAINEQREALGVPQGAPISSVSESEPP